MFKKASIIATFDAGMDAFDMDIDVCDLNENALRTNDILTQSIVGVRGTLLGDNYYSVLGDEDAEGALDDFDDPSCYDSQDDFVSSELSKNKVHMDEPNTFRCVQVSGGDGSAPDLPVPSRVNITKEDTYNNGTEFVRVVDEYCKEQKFDYRIDSSKREWPKDILPEDKPDDSISYVSIVCSRSGAPRTKKEGLAPEKRRNRKSNKCGCGYHVEARWDADTHRFTIRSVSLQHTNGCTPSFQQQLITTAKKTTGKINRIPRHVLAEIGRMLAEGQPIKWIRSRIRYHIPQDIKTDARWFMNLRAYFERLWLKEKQSSGVACASVAENPVQNETNPLRPAPTSRSDIPSVVPDTTIISAVMRSIVGPVLRMVGLPVLNILEKLRKSVPGFMYRYLLDKDGQLAGWCYSTPRQRAALEDSGHIIFADFKAKGTNKYGWPYFSHQL